MKIEETTKAIAEKDKQLRNIQKDQRPPN